MATTMLIVNSGLDRETQLALNKGAAVGNDVAHLYVNSHTPTVADTVASYTQCSATGYSSITLTGSSWTGSTTGGVSDYSYPGITFTFTDNGGGQTIYGVYVTDPTGVLHMAGLLDVPFVIPSGGGSITVYLEYKHQNC